MSKKQENNSIKKPDIICADRVLKLSSEIDVAICYLKAPYSDDKDLEIALEHVQDDIRDINSCGMDTSEFEKIFKEIELADIPPNVTDPLIRIGKLTELRERVIESYLYPERKKERLHNRELLRKSFSVKGWGPIK